MASSRLSVSAADSGETRNKLRNSTTPPSNMAPQAKTRFLLFFMMPSVFCVPNIPFLFMHPRSSYLPAFNFPQGQCLPSSRHLQHINNSKPQQINNAFQPAVPCSRSSPSNSSLRMDAGSTDSGDGFSLLRSPTASTFAWFSKTSKAGSITRVKSVPNNKP